MFEIRPKQMRAFEEAALERFEEEMIAHGRDFSPRLCETIGDDQLRLAVRTAMDRAMSYGFTNRGPIRLFIEMMLLFGSGFDTDPQYPNVAELLQGVGDQMWRAEKIHEGQLDYYRHVSGPKASNVHTALQRLRIFAGQDIRFSGSGFAADMLGEIDTIFPEKVAYIGEQAMLALIDEGRSVAAEYDFDTDRARALIVSLMFAFGHGCTSDPLYPWIQRTLQDERITDPIARSRRLEKKALTWLDHVIAANQQRSRS